MLRKKADQLSTTQVKGYASRNEFCRIFAEDENALYLLSLLLTADGSKAEQCFVAGLEDSIQGNSVFKEWARSWSKRMIVKNAIRMISPAPGQVSSPPPVSDAGAVGLDLGGELAAVLELAPLERFVFVMSTLEGYSIQECSILLNCTRQTIEIAQAGAVRRLTSARVNRITPLTVSSDIPRPAHFLEPVPAA